MIKIINKIWYYFLDTIFPIECIGCGENFEELSLIDRWLCPDCTSKINIRNEQVCPVCEKRSEGGKVHFSCGNKTSMDGLWVCAYYEDLLEKLIYRFKFDFIKDISRIISNKMVISILDSEELSDFHDIIMSNSSKYSEESIYVNGCEDDDSGNTIVIPVPLHKKRYNWRGFNQSELLASHIAYKFRLQEGKDILIRKRNTKPQSKIDSQQDRLDNIKGAFVCQKGGAVKNKNIIIIDDLCTTSATINECALELKKAGANKVWGLVVARR